MFKIANNVQNLLQYVMPFWKFELTSKNQNFGNVAIKNRQGLDPLIQTVRIFSSDICM